jgi:hypothetical protein
MSIQTTQARRRFVAMDAEIPGTPEQVWDAIATGPGMDAVAKSGNTCVVCVAHSLYTDRDDWDKQLEFIESGWPDYFRLLALCRRHFPGMYAKASQFMTVTAKPPADV